jgi:TonB family protein
VRNPSLTTYIDLHYTLGEANMKTDVAIALTVLIGTIASAQTGPEGVTVSRPSGLEAPVLNAPYSAEQRQVNVAATLNGIPGTQTSRSTKIFRDSRGRIRTESVSSTSRGAQLLVSLTDAQAARRCFLDNSNKVAHCFSSLPVNPGVAVPPGRPDDIGSQTIGGLRAEGKAYATSLGGQPGNLPARIVTRQIWTSPELQISLQTQDYDPLIGSNVLTMANLLRTEPEASLFEVPADYRTVNEPGTVAVLFSSGPVQAQATAPAAVPPPARVLPPGVFRPGNGVSIPKAIKKPEPEYSEEARLKKVNGQVTLSAIIGVNGRVTDIQVDKPLGYGLDEKAIQAVSQWRFEPAQKDGKPVAILATIMVNFTLLDPPPVR